MFALLAGCVLLPCADPEPFLDYITEPCYVTDLNWFPTREQTEYRLEECRRFQELLRWRWDQEPANRVQLDRLQAETRRLEQILDTLSWAHHYAHQSRNPYALVERLEQYQQLVGPERYYQGWVPIPVPWLEFVELNF
jgi:hypothetical protein